MNKYKVTVKTSNWYNDTYIVEAESEEDISCGEVLGGEFLDSEYDCLDQVVSIKNIELIEEPAE